MKDQNKKNQKQQVYNPFLPLNEYIPDGEPHVFGDRVYHFGSHDKEGGYTFCMLDYVANSAPVTDLSDWRYEGVIYQAKQDPRYPDPQYMYAPDVVQGNDGRYYLYYCMGGDYGQGGYQGPISVAVCDEPAGHYEYLGIVKNPDGSPMMKYICFDPAAINDNGTIRIYYGTQYDYEERADFMENDSYMQEEIEMFGRSREEILSYPDSIMGTCMVVLEDDMVTVKEEARHIIPYRVKGTSFETHPFFEGSSMRKVGDRYYFVYSSWQNHELCYAVSRYPDRDFTFGGTIVSNGDIGAVFQISRNLLGMFHVLFIAQLVIQTCPEVHGNRTDLDLDLHRLFTVGEEDRNLQDQVQAAITVFLWILNIIFGLDQSHIILLGQHLCHFINVINKRTDHSDACNIMQILNDAFQRNIITPGVKLFQNTFRRFDPGFDEGDRIPLITDGKLIV